MIERNEISESLQRWLRAFGGQTIQLDINKRVERDLCCHNEGNAKSPANQILKFNPIGGSSFAGYRRNFKDITSHQINKTIFIYPPKLLKKLQKNRNDYFKTSLAKEVDFAIHRDFPCRDYLGHHYPTRSKKNNQEYRYLAVKNFCEDQYKIGFLQIQSFFMIQLDGQIYIITENNQLHKIIDPDKYKQINSALTNVSQAEFNSYHPKYLSRTDINTVLAIKQYEEDVAYFIEEETGFRIKPFFTCGEQAYIDGHKNKEAILTQTSFVFNINTPYIALKEEIQMEIEKELRKKTLIKYLFNTDDYSYAHAHLTTFLSEFNRHLPFIDKKFHRKDLYTPDYPYSIMRLDNTDGTNTWAILGRTYTNALGEIKKEIYPLEEENGRYYTLTGEVREIERSIINKDKYVYLATDSNFAYQMRFSQKAEWYKFYKMPLKGNSAYGNPIITKMNVDEKLSIFISLADQINNLHEINQIHGEINLKNVILEDTSKNFITKPQLTDPKNVIFSGDVIASANILSFSSPEAIAATVEDTVPAGTASDIYHLGIVFAAFLMNDLYTTTVLSEKKQYYEAHFHEGICPDELHALNQTIAGIPVDIFLESDEILSPILLLIEDFLLSMLDQNAVQRPEIQEISDFFSLVRKIIHAKEIVKEDKKLCLLKKLLDALKRKLLREHTPSESKKHLINTWFEARLNNIDANEPFYRDELNEDPTLQAIFDNSKGNPFFFIQSGGYKSTTHKLFENLAKQYNQLVEQFNRIEQEHQLNMAAQQL